MDYYTMLVAIYLGLPALFFGVLLALVALGIRGARK